MTCSIRLNLVRGLTAAVLAIGGTTCGGVERIGDDDTGTGTDGGSDATVPQWVQAAFDRSCAVAGCHGSGGLPPSLALGESDAIIGGLASNGEMPLVELGNLDGSYLALKLLPAALHPDGAEVSGSQMPPAPTDDSDQDVATILGWIAGTPAAAATDSKSSSRIEGDHADIDAPSR